jgi:ferric-chelate reductase [NAD(P)H]
MSETKKRDPLLSDVSYGLYLVSSMDGKKLNGQLTNSVFQVCAEPPMFAAAVNKQNLTHEYIEKSGVFTVSPLRQGTPMEFIGLFGFRSGRDIEKFAKTKYKIGNNGAPIVLDNTISVIEVSVTKKVSVGTHTLFIGKVTCSEILSDEKPLTYEYYHDFMKGKTHKNATTYKGD